MAANSSAAFASPQIGFLPVSEKLTRSNYVLWRLQVLLAIRSAQLAEYIEPSAQPPEMYLAPAKGDSTSDEKKPPVRNHDYDKWIAKDQTVLNFLLTSLSKEIFSQVMSSADTAAKAWAVIEALFASQSRARVIATRMALATASKGTSTIAEYFTKMKSLANEMASAGKKLEDDELVSYILTGLDLDFEGIVSAVAARVEPISVGELYTQLTSHEQCMELCNSANNPSANMATKGGGHGNYNKNSRGRGGDGCGGFGHGSQKGGRGGGGRGNSFIAGVYC